MGLKIFRYPNSNMKCVLVDLNIFLTIISYNEILMIEIKEILTDEQINHLALIGRLDLAGSEQIELKFTTIVATRAKPTLIDLSQLEYITSLGLRMILSSAKTLRSKSAKMVLLKPTNQVLEILTTVGFDKLIPIENDLEKAKELLK